MADLAKLVVRFEAETAKLNKELETTRKKLGTFSKSAKKSTSAVSVAFGVLAADAARSALSFSKSLIDTADSISKLSQSTGVAVEALSAYDFAVGISGGNTEDLTKSLRGLARSASDASRGLKNDIDAFSALGVAFEDSEGNLRDTEQLLLDVAEAFSGFQDGAAKSAVAQELFGRSGTKLIPFLNQGRDGLAALTAEAEELGIVLDTDAAQAAEAFNDNLLRLRKVSEGVGLQIVQGILPTLEKLSDLWIENTKNAGKFAESARAVEAGVKLIASAAELVTTAFSIAGEALGGFAAAAVALFQGEFSQAASIAEDALSRIAETGAQSAETLQFIWEDTVDTVVTGNEEVAETAAEAAKAVLNYGDSSEDAAKKIGKTRSAIDSTIQGLELQAALLGKNETEATLYKLALDGATAQQIEYAKSLRTAIDEFAAAQEAQASAEKAAEDAAKKAAETAEKAKEGLFDIAEFGKEAAQNLESSFADFLFDPFEGGLKGMAKSFGATLQRMIADAAAADLFSRLGLSGGGAATGQGVAGLLGNFAGFFNLGGTVPSGSWGIAGENGPELVFGGQSVVSTADTAQMLQGSTNYVTVNVPQANNTADMRQAAGAGARAALAQMREAQRYE